MILEIMNNIHDWVDAIVNNPTGSVPVIPSHINVPQPSGTYITIKYAPDLSSVGKADWEIIEDTGLYYMVLKTDFEAIVEIWETNGIGENLIKLVNYQWMEEANKILKSNYISILRNGDILTVSSELAQERWINESVLEMTFGFASGLKYETNYIENIVATGTLEKPDGSTREIIVTKD